MSREVDERVVSMQFDNKRFEKNVAQSMSTLDKLKQKLNLTGAAKGLENVNTAARKVDMTPLANGVETVRAKFSAMEVMGVTALANITNSAINAGKNLVKSLSIDQVMSGYSKYDQKTASVQTLMNSTGKSIEEINEYLEKLMWFSDETSYGFTDMTAALAQMTSSGGDINKLVPLITGVANATAYAGKGASEFSRVMYNLNQSYGAGYLQLMDWKSVELAGVGSQQLKQSLIDAGVALGKIQNGEVTIANFASTLKDKWADTAVMEKAFGSFSEFSDAVHDMVASGDADTAAEAIDKLSGKYTELGEKAFKSAQEAKTFTEAIDATKDAVSSGWMRTFEIIFGSYDKAKKTWTGLANWLWDVFASGGEDRNAWLEEALSFSPVGKFLEKLDSVKKVTETASKSLEYYQDMVNKVWRGDYKNQPVRSGLLEAEGHNYSVIQSLVNKGYQYKLTLDDVTEAEKKFGVTTTEVTKTLESLTDEELANIGMTKDEIRMYRDLEKQSKKTGKSIAELVSEMESADGRTLLMDSFSNIGTVILDLISTIKEAWTEIFPPMTAVQLYNIIAKFHELTEALTLTDETTGELNETGDKIFRTFKGLFAALDIGLTLLSGPAKLIFKIVTKILESFGVSVLDATAYIGDAIVRFRDWIDTVLDFGGIFDKIAPYIKNAIDAVRNWFAAVQPLEKVGNVFKGIADKVRDLSNTLRNNDIVQNLIAGLKNGLKSGATAVWEGIKNLAKGIINTIKKILGIHSPSTVMAEIGENLTEGFVVGLKNGISAIIKTITDLCSKIIGAFSGLEWSKIGTIFMNIANLFPQLKIFKTVASIGNIVSAAGGDVMSGLAKGIGNGASAVMEAISTVASSLIETFKRILGIHSPSRVMIAVGGFIIAGLLLGLEGGVSSVGDFFNNLGTNTIGFIGGFATKIREFISRIDFGSVLVAALATGLGLMIKKCLDIAKEFTSALKNFSKVGEGLGNFFNALANRISPPVKKLNFADIAKGILQIAIAIGILAGSVYLLAQLDYGKLWSSVGALATLAVIMAGMMAATKLMSDTSDPTKPLLAMAGIIFVMSLILKTLSKMSPGEAWNGVGIIAAFAAIIVGLMAATKYLAGGRNIDKIANMILKVAFAIGIMMLALKLAASMSPGEAWNGVGIIAAFGVIIAGLMYATKLITGSRNIDKMGSSILKVAFAIGIMMLAIKIAASMSPGEAWNGVAIVIAFSAIMVGLIGAMKYFSTPADADKLGSSLLKIAFAIGIMMLAIKISASIPPGLAWNGVAIVAAFSGIVAGLMAAAKCLTGGRNISKIGNMLLKVSFAIGIMVLALKLAASIPIGQAWNGVGVIAAFSAMIVGLMAATKLISGSRNIDKIGNMFLKIAVVIGVMALSVSLLTLVDQGKLWSGVGAIAVLIAAVSLLVYTSKNMTSSMGSLITMTVIIAILAGTLITLSCLDTAKVFGAAAAISVVMAVMAVVFALSSKMTGSIMPLIGMAGAIAIIAGALLLLTLIPADKLQSASMALIAIAGALLVLGVAAAVISKVAPTALTSIAIAMLAFGVSVLATAVGVLLFANAFSILATSIQNGGGAILNFIVQLAVLFPFLAKQFGSGLVALFQGIAGSSAALFNALKVIILSALDMLVTLIPAIAEATFKLIVGMLEILIEYLPQIVPLLVTLFVKLIDLLVENMPAILDGVVKFLVSLIDGIASRLTEFTQPIVNLLRAIFEGIAAVLGPVTQEVLAPVLEILLQHFVDLFGVLAPYMPEICKMFTDLATIIADSTVKIMEVLAPYIPTICDLVAHLATVIADSTVRITEILAPYIPDIKEIVLAIVDAVVVITQEVTKLFQEISPILDSISNIIKETGDAIRNSLDGVADIFDSAFGGIADVIERVGDAVRSFLDGIAGIIDSIGEAALNAGTGFDRLSKGIERITKLNLVDMAASLTAVATGLGKIAKHSDGISETGTGMKKIADSVKISVTAFNQIAVGISTMSEKLSSIGPVAEDAMIKLTTAMTNSASSISTISKNISEAISGITTSIKTMGTSCIAAIDSFKTKFSTAGSNLIQGLAAGITASKPLAVAAALDVANSVETIIRSAWQINSPSKVFYRIALGIGEGIEYALGDSIIGVKHAATNLGDVTSNTISSAISNIAAAMDSDMDMQPTIRPVLDLSGVKDGANSIAGMFSGNRTLAISAPGVGAISASMANRQNGNSDLVSAINKLAKSSGKSGDTYQINGINYSEGSDVADAIQTLVRAAKMEGRA